MIPAATQTDFSEALARPIDLPVRVPVFEGPLDLLLYLIRRNEVDIYDIPITTITRQYLEALRRMESLRLEVAGEFFVMAATLMHIKSRLLLPRDRQSPADDPGAEEEDGVDPRWELVGQLIAYRKFKALAGDLEKRVQQARNTYARETPKAREETERPWKSPGRIELWNTFNNVLRRLAEKITVGEIHEDSVTVADQMEYLLGLSRQRKRFAFTELFREGPLSFAKLVSTFLAMLELARLKRLSLWQEENFGELYGTFHDETGTEEASPEGAETEPDR